MELCRRDMRGTFPVLVKATSGRQPSTESLSMRMTTSGWQGAARKTTWSLSLRCRASSLRRFGRRGKSGGSSDTQNLGGPANLTVDTASNELYVGDGYRNHRVVVIDAETLTFKRIWGVRQSA
jgi:NHL repeat